MAGFFSGLLGRAPAAETPDTTDYDTTPCFRAPASLTGLDTLPAPTSTEQTALDNIKSQRTALLADLPEEPSDGRARFNAEKWLDEQRMLMYVRANKGNGELAAKKLRATLEWRCTYRPHAITPEDMELEGSVGKQYLNGFDNQGHPILYMFPHRQNTKDANEQLRWVVFTMEQAIRAMPDKVTKISIVIDVSKYSMSQSVPLSTAREFLNILEGHYPERLYKAFVLSPPTLFVMFYHIVAPFIDPVTKSKIAFVNVNGKKQVDGKDGPWVNIDEFVDKSRLQREAGGEWDFKFDREHYWPVLVKEYEEFVAAETKA
ncbi:CRAL/TRIO domain-containing protein [Linderina pennispora]|uniref:CRAL/TRIO domain-containing protein n=1 Tax=Linderina pennispora TaxID=61395 RepID=A0A1Y1W5D0_9FUNG|nr:CRAL/TRIO domain-containing protein [Linderina pennispora]ORX68414.1 CRAL/TRIO domain-containing protein [Linderina pennispora]